MTDLRDWGALFLGLAAFVTASTGMVALLIGQRRGHERSDRLLRAVNHVEDEVAESGPTLGQRVKQIHEELGTTHDGPMTIGERMVDLQGAVAMGFENNEQVHEEIRTEVHESVAAVNDRIDQMGSTPE